MGSCLPANSDCCCSGYTISSADLQIMINSAVAIALAANLATVLPAFVFDNVAALRATTIHPNKCPAWILFETVVGDGSPGFYTYSSTSLLPDNVPAVIEPNDVGPAVAGRWIKRL